MRRIMTLLLVAFTLIARPSRAADDPRPKETEEQRDQRMAWWREARFGMFVHWGLYAIPGGQWKGKSVGKGRVGEWIMNDLQIPVAEYEKLAGQFNPAKFDAREWVRIAKGAGMRYVVLTSKHHDGFCLWDSKVTTYDVMDATPFKRDIVKELAAACEAEGIVLCFYHSIMDWHHPDAQAPHYPDYNTDKKRNPNFPRYVETYLKPQVKELLMNYGRVGVMWFDGEWIPEWTEDMGKDMEAYCRSLQPNVIVNNRVGKGRQGMQGMNRDASFAGDFGTPEQEIPPTGFPGLDWESCVTMNDTWGFRKDDENWKSADAMIRMLVETASKGGNLLMNVGPTPEGEIPKASVERLAEVGKWMKVNGEAIYATSASPFPKLSFGRATMKQKLYLHVFDWPENRTLRVPLSNGIEKAYLLASPEKELPTLSTDLVHVTVPERAPAPSPVVVVVDFDCAPQVVELPRVIRPQEDGSLVLLAIEADVFARRARIERKGENPYNIGYWTDVRDYVQWHVDIAKPGRYEVQLEYSAAPNSGGSEYAIEVRDQSLKSKIEPTQSFLDFKTIPLGTLEIKEAGTTQLTLRPLTKPGVAVMDLRKLLLRPL
jgi:alpha-L-fucosidase